MQPSFPIPDVLATPIVMEENFGIIAVPKTLVEHYQMRSLPASDALAIPMTGDTPLTHSSASFGKAVDKTHLVHILNDHVME